MEKLLLMIALCLLSCIASVAELENANIGQHDRITTDNTTTFSTENSFEDLVVTTSPEDSGMQSKVETASISETTKLEDVSNKIHLRYINNPERKEGFITNEKKQMYENKTSLVYLESVLNGGLSKNSSNEKKGDENVSFVRTTDPLNVPSENVSVSSSVLQADLTTTNTDISNESLRADLDKTPNQSSYSSNVDLAVNDTSAVSAENEGMQKYIMQNSTPHKYLEEGSDSFTAMESPNLKSPLSTSDVEPLTRVHNFSNSPVAVSHEDKFSTTDDPINSSTYFPPEHSESSLFPKSSLDDEITHIDDITPSSTSLASENSESHLVAPTVRKISEDADFASTPGRNFTEENNHLTAINNPQEKITISELLTKDKKEINSSHPTISLSSVIYEEENVESHSVQNTTQNNSTNYLVNIPDRGTIVESSIIDASPVDLDKHATHTSIIPEVFFSTNLTDSTLHTQENSEKVSLVSTPDSSNQNISDYVPEKDASPPSKETLNQVYKLTLTRNCSDVFASQAMQSITEILNRRLNAQNSTELVRCVNIYEFNFTSDIASRESFDEAVRIIHETMNPDLEASIVNYTSIVNDVSCNPYVDSENFVIPKLVVYISTALTAMIIIFMIFVVLCLRKRCKNNSSSVDLSHMPHVALSLDDYKVAPIPRPSISYPETNRDFLYAYSNETYSRTPDDLIIQRHYSNGIGKETDASKLQKENSMTLEMETFDKKGDVQRNRSKSTPDYEYASAGYWDRLRGRGVGKRQSHDNSAMKW